MDATAPISGSHRNAWTAFLLRRLLALVAVLVGLLIVTFMMVRLIPGNPAELVVGPTASAAQISRVSHQLGLDMPLPQQFVAYVTDLAHLNLGEF